MSAYPGTWSLCGGWAVDAWLGRQSRAHGDIDVSVFHDEQRKIFEHLAGWHLIAHDPNVPGDTTEPWEGRHLDLPAHIHASLSSDAVKAWVSRPRSPAREDEPMKLEIVIDERADGNWILRSEPRIALPVAGAIEESPWGLPTAAPEVILFFKATAYLGVPGLHDRPHDTADFEALLPQLSGGRRDWLRQSIAGVDAGQSWLARLA
jgi:hypothetical protein